MNDEERLKTIREILNQVSSRNEADGSYWGADTEMSRTSVEKPALAALKRFEGVISVEAYNDGWDDAEEAERIYRDETD